ncbi:hypothetical protein GGR50DRAFT_693885 [Xylaria sp. CBS 124048]|nr:hypothetical protein GGR50DRAFT_693885 [Xylaria sp. CBS 124048]
MPRRDSSSIRDGKKPERRRSDSRHGESSGTSRSNRQEEDAGSSNAQLQVHNADQSHSYYQSGGVVEEDSEPGYYWDVKTKQWLPLATYQSSWEEQPPYQQPDLPASLTPLKISRTFLRVLRNSYANMEGNLNPLAQSGYQLDSGSGPANPTRRDSQSQAQGSSTGYVEGEVFDEEDEYEDEGTEGQHGSGKDPQDGRSAKGQNEKRDKRDRKDKKDKHRRRQHKE